MSKRIAFSFTLVTAWIFFAPSQVLAVLMSPPTVTGEYSLGFSGGSNSFNDIGYNNSGIGFNGSYTDMPSSQPLSGSASVGGHALFDPKKVAVEYAAGGIMVTGLGPLNNSEPVSDGMSLVLLARYNLSGPEEPVYTSASYTFHGELAPGDSVHYLLIGASISYANGPTVDDVLMVDQTVSTPGSFSGSFVNEVPETFPSTSLFAAPVGVELDYSVIITKGGSGTSYFQFDDPGVSMSTSVPEPSSFALLSIGAIASISCHWRRRAA